MEKVEPGYREGATMTMTDREKALLDAWITGNYGEDHPDNFAEEPEMLDASEVLDELYDYFRESGEEPMYKGKNSIRVGGLTVTVEE